MNQTKYLRFKQFIIDLHERFSRKASNAALEDYIDVVEKFNPDLVAHVIKHLRKSEKSLPTPADVEKCCMSMKGYFETKSSVSPSDLICRYFEASESALSKSLCQKFDERWAEVSIAMHGKPICDWHQCIMRAGHPDDFSAKKYVADRLEAAQARKELGDEAYFLQTLGFDPDRIAPENVQKAIFARLCAGESFTGSTQDAKKKITVSSPVETQRDLACHFERIRQYAVKHRDNPFKGEPIPEELMPAYSQPVNLTIGGESVNFEEIEFDIR